MVSIDDSQAGFVPGGGIRDEIFVVRQMQNKCLTVNTHINMAFPDLEKAFCVPPNIYLVGAERYMLPRE